MRLKINKACDLSSISVLPPQSRRSIVAHSGPESSSILGRSQAASQLRSQQQKLQQSQQSSQGISSQHGLFSQFSQNSQDEILTNEKIGSQERENSEKRTSCLPPINYSREESQMMIPRTSSNLVRRWSGQEYKCQISEELEHRIGMIETSLSRLGMILDSVQSDIMQVNKGTKEVAFEMEGMRQKLIVQDDSMQLMNKGQEDIKTRLDLGLTSVFDKLKQNDNQESFREIFSMLSALSEKIDIQMRKLQNDLCKDFSKEMQAMAFSMKSFKQIQATPPIQRSKAANSRGPLQELQLLNNATLHSKSQQATLVPKDEMGGWTSVKHKQETSKAQNLDKRINQESKRGVVIESDEEIDGGFSCLLKEKRTEIEDYLIEEVKEETARILRKARRRKRKYCNTIIIN